MNNWLKIHLTAPIVTFLGKRKEGRHFSRAPILIGGCGRSGTTLMLSILSAHPKIFAFSDETDAFTHWKKKGTSYLPIRIDRMYRKLLRQQVPTTAHRWCEKRPYNIRFISEILSHFGPDARFVNIIRDPRAVCTSEHPRRPGQYWIEPERWIEDVSAGLVFEGHPQVFTVKYEELISNTDQVIRKLCQFVNEDTCPEVLDWYHYAKVRSNRAWKGEVQPAHADSLEKWKIPAHAARIAALMANSEIRRLMDRLGYS